jgi:hypothetical protein
VRRDARDRDASSRGRDGLVSRRAVAPAGRAARVDGRAALNCTSETGVFRSWPRLRASLRPVSFEKRKNWCHTKQHRPRQLSTCCGRNRENFVPDGMELISATGCRKRQIRN